MNKTALIVVAALCCGACHPTISVEKMKEVCGAANAVLDGNRKVTAQNLALEDANSSLNDANSKAIVMAAKWGAWTGDAEFANERGRAANAQVRSDNADVQRANTNSQAALDKVCKP